MSIIVDFSNCILSERNLQYGGRAGEKRGIIYNNEYWFLKFPKNASEMKKTENLSYVTSPLSEYVGSHIYEILGYDVHKTMLGICFDGKRYKVVCACKDFINDDQNEILIPYTSLRNDTSEAIMEYNNSSSRGSAANLDEIIFQLKHNTVLKEIKGMNERFWDTVVIDLIINNNDRNEDNWGLIKYKKENIYKIAPIYDNGNSFNSKHEEERIKLIINDIEKLYSSSINGITAYTDENSKHYNFSRMVKLNNDDYKKSLKKVCDNFEKHFEEIKSFIVDIPQIYNDILIMSNERKEYYIKTMKIRLDIMKNEIENQ